MHPDPETGTIIYRSGMNPKTASKRFYGVTEFCYYALADGVGALLSRISPKKPAPPLDPPPDMLPGFA